MGTPTKMQRALSQRVKALPASSGQFYASGRLMAQPLRCPASRSSATTGFRAAPRTDDPATAPAGARLMAAGGQEPLISPRARRGARLAGAWRLRPGPLALGQDQRCRRMLEHAGPRAPAGVVVAHRQHRTGDGQVQPHRPRIARCHSGDDSEATVGIVGTAAPARDFFPPVGPGRPLDADHGLPLRPPQHSSAGPLEGQHPSGQCHGQRREAPPLRTGSPGNLRLERAWKPHVHPGSGAP